MGSEQVVGTNWLAFAKDQREVGGQLTEARVGFDLLPNSQETDNSYFEVRRVNDQLTITERRRRPDARRYRAGSIAALLAMAALFADPTSMAGDVPNESRALPPGTPVTEDAASPAADAPGTLGELLALPPASFAKPVLFVFVAEDGVTVLLNESERRETIRFGFQVSAPMKRIQALQSAYTFDQRGLVDTLRREIAGIYSPVNVIAQLRQVKFVNNESGDSNVQTGRESVGRSIQRELTNITADFPEEVSITVPYFDNVFDSTGKPLTVTVRCALDTDITNQKFYLRPIAGELEKHKQAVLALICEQLKEGLASFTNVHVFAGSAT